MAKGLNYFTRKEFQAVYDSLNFDFDVPIKDIAKLFAAYRFFATNEDDSYLESVGFDTALVYVDAPDLSKLFMKAFVLEKRGIDVSTRFDFENRSDPKFSFGKYISENVLFEELQERLLKAGTAYISYLDHEIDFDFVFHCNDDLTPVSIKVPMFDLFSSKTYIDKWALPLRQAYPIIGESIKMILDETNALNLQDLTKEAIDPQGLLEDEEDEED